MRPASYLNTLLVRVCDLRAVLLFYFSCWVPMENCAQIISLRFESHHADAIPL